MQSSQSNAKRQRRSTEEIQAILADLARSGSSVLGYARDHSLSASTLTYWRDRHLGKPSSRATAAATSFVEVHPQAGESCASDEQLEVVLDNGLILRFRARAIASLDLKHLLSSLRAC